MRRKEIDSGISGPMKPALKIAVILTGIAAVASIEPALMFWAGRRDVRNFCDEARPGFPVAQLPGVAGKHNVRLGMPGSRESSGAYLALAHTPRSFGRHTCAVRHDNREVIESRFEYAD